ncbi:MAG: DUF6458 family protein [Actinomycetota bacterium]|nr:DUF6458 family protein [Actinomycetota bacterium]
MGIGTSIFLLAVGAILAFAVTDAISGVDLTTVGYILMAAGAVGLLISMLVLGRGRRTVVREPVARERDVY